MQYTRCGHREPYGFSPCRPIRHFGDCAGEEPPKVSESSQRCDACFRKAASQLDSSLSQGREAAQRRTSEAHHEQQHRQAGASNGHLYGQPGRPQVPQHGRSGGHHQVSRYEPTEGHQVSQYGRPAENHQAQYERLQIGRIFKYRTTWDSDYSISVRIESRGRG